MQGSACKASSVSVALARPDHGVPGPARAAERAQRGAVQVFQQPALPAVPDLGAGAADVGHRQQVERSGAARRRRFAAKASITSGRSGPASAPPFIVRCSATRSDPRHRHRRCHARGRSAAPLGADLRMVAAAPLCRCRGTAPARYSSQGLSQPAASWEQNGYSCECSGTGGTLRSTIRICWSTADVEQVMLHLSDDLRNTTGSARAPRSGSSAAARASRPRPAAGSAGRSQRLRGSRRNAAFMTGGVVEMQRSVR